MKGLLDGRTVIVTGAGSGMGEGIALACATHGANVLIAARRKETGDAVAAAIERRGGSALSVRCDVTLRDDVYSAVSSAVSAFGALDAMIHSALAPVGAPREIQNTPDEIWRSMLGTAVRASYLCATASYPHLEASQGTFILITSSSGIEGSPYSPAYALVKAAQRGLAKSLAREWGAKGVRVNCIGPVAMTPRMKSAATANPEVLAADGRLIARTPLRRIGDPEADIGPVAVFLVSELSRYMTGQTLMADGGGLMAF